VIRGLDPRIHYLPKTSFGDGLPAQAHGCPV
jgi:hypothetical protein